MNLYRFTPAQIEAAVATCNAGANAGELRFETTRQHQLKRSGEWRIRGVLRLRNGRSPGARLSPTGNRRTNSADWETHYAFMAALFAANPQGRIETMLATYENEASFYFQCNKAKAHVVGPAMAPRTFGSLTHVPV